MPKPIPETDLNFVLKFGAGIHSRGSEADIDIRECVSGQNFLLDIENMEMRNRKPFDKVGTVPNGAEIRGFVTLKDDAGTITHLVQAGSVVYSWSGTGFSSVGNVSASAKIRGRKEHYWPLDDKVIITDVNLAQPVGEWDGTTLATMTHNLSGTFLAKYCHIENERAIYGNVISNGTATPHMLVGSALGDHNNLSTSSRPASGATAADPWFLLTLDLKPINGLASSFGVMAISSKDGKMFKLTGQDKTDFAIDDLYPDSAASGDEAVVFTGNDILYGAVGRIESLLQSDKFGDVENDDISRMISDSISGYSNWRIVYDRERQLVYCFPNGKSEAWVLDKTLLPSSEQRLLNALSSGSAKSSVDISPWSKYVTQHSLTFQPTAVMNMYDPRDGLEYVFMGDGSGNLYRMEGTGTSGDGGSASIKTVRRSMLFSAPLDAYAYDVEGYVRHRVNDAHTLTLRFLCGGRAAFNRNLTLTLQGVTDRPLYKGGLYYSDGNYYSSAFDGRLVREPFKSPFRANEFQIEAEISGTDDFQISEIGVQFTGSKN